MINVGTPPITNGAIAQVVGVLQSGNLVQGKYVEKFEHMFAEYIGTKYAVAVNSGTAALVSSLLACGIGKGDYVAVPAYTFFATVEAVLLVGAKPVFVDLDPKDLTMSAKSFSKIREEVKAVIPVHIFGGVCDLEGINGEGSYSGFVTIEDCAQAHGAIRKHKKVGSQNDAGCFSFYATKHITTIEGGMVTTDARDISNYIKLYRSHGMSGYHTHSILGHNYRMNEVGAVLGISGLESLDERLVRRREIAKRFMEETAVRHYVGNPDNHAFFIFPMKATPELRSRLNDNGIPYRKRYLTPLYNQPVIYNDYEFDRWGSCPVAEAEIPNLIGLPCHENLTEADVDKIIGVLNGTETGA